MSTKSSSNNSKTRFTLRNEVVSKYFVGGKSSMDDSAEFQESKKSYKGPKTGPSTSTAKSKGKRTTKKTKGQKDIRVALKSKKNELIAYSEDFEKVCKTSGIDLDCDQLQLAIALSKSLQEVGNEQSSCSVPSTSQQRVRNIRTTLQEYGFQVPEVKIVKKRCKKIRKNSKLLLITDEERKQIIADRYAQVLIQDLKCCVSNENLNKTDNTIFPLYHITSNTPYELLRNDTAFYVANLLEISLNKIGSLLKDWSKIPGRPKSPNQTRPMKAKFWDIQYTQEELDTILSGSIQRAQEVVYFRMDSVKTQFQKDPARMKDHEDSEITSDDNEDRNIQKKVVKPLNISRCVSPDLFDDDMSEIENTRENRQFDKTLSQRSSQDDLEICKITSNFTRTTCNDFMDLTKCVNGLSQPTASKIEHIELVLINSDQDNTPQPTTKPPDHIDITRRKSNDFMEITNCVTAVIQPKYAENNDKIDLTQSLDEDETENTIIGDDANVTVKRVIENMDLTQSSNSDDDTLPFVEISGKKIDASFPIAENKRVATSDVEIVIDDEAIIIPVVTRQSCVEVPDTFDKLNRAKERMSKSSEESSVFEEYSFVHSDQDNKSADNPKVDSSNDANVSVDCDDIDLTQSSDTSGVIPLAVIHLTAVEDNNSLGKKDDISIDYDEVTVINENKTCLNLGRHTNENNKQLIDNFSENNEENQSILLDEFVISINCRESITKYNSNISIIEKKPVTSDSNILSDAASEVFEISDEELNYSIHKSKLSNTQELVEYDPNLDKMNFDLGGVSSLMENMSSFQTNSKSSNSLNTTARDSILPEVEIKGTKVKSPAKSSTSKTTPVKDNNKDKLVQTPSNKEYIIKTNQVTPMLDYESMSTPQRNEELEKYGLKPFKRKRAIKLLTHLYDQTHPVVENCAIENMPSPSKRHKPNVEPKTTPSKTSSSKSHLAIQESPKSNRQKTLKKANSISPRKAEISGEGDENIDLENDDYEETNHRADIRDLDDGDTDWVFQKREKAKVHSCRVPLHIAFHNYVASRGGLRDAILRYEPVSIDVIHKQLVGYGHRYDPKDLLRFLDKKCITVKTADNSTRNIKRSQKKS